MARDRSSVLAARAKDPSSATRVNTRIACSWSMGPDCKEKLYSEFDFVCFFRGTGSVGCATYRSHHVRLQPLIPRRHPAARVTAGGGALVQCERNRGWQAGAECRLESGHSAARAEWSAAHRSERDPGKGTLTRTSMR